MKRCAPKRFPVYLRPEKLVCPILGTVEWSDDGEALGVWGQDLPMRYRLRLPLGRTRDLTLAEQKLAERMYGKPGICS